jgi:hypothetical protein
MQELKAIGDRHRSNVNPNENYNAFSTKIYGGGSSSFSGKMSPDGKLINLSDEEMGELRKNMRGYCAFMGRLYKIHKQLPTDNHKSFDVYRVAGLSSSRVRSMRIGETINFPLPSSGTHSLNFVFGYLPHVDYQTNKVVFVFKVDTSMPLLYLSVPEALKEGMLRTSHHYNVAIPQGINSEQGEIFLPPGNYVVTSRKYLVNVNGVLRNYYQFRRDYIDNKLPTLWEDTKLSTLWEDNKILYVTLDGMSWKNTSVACKNRFL